MPSMLPQPLYDRLQHHDSIRLFKLLPSASETDQLQGVLMTTRRSQSPEYRALSYMWGPPDPSREVPLLVNTNILPLRSNLASALHAYREHCRHGRIRQDIPLWIDLICIQQSCTEEKNHQVQQMGAIYSQARSVLIWLGRETKVPLSTHYHGSSSSALDLHNPLTGEVLEKPKYPAMLRALYWSLLNKHWTRTWILQEICLAQRVAIFTEDFLFKGEILQQFQTQKIFLEEAYAESWRPSNEDPNPHATAVRLTDRFCKIWTVRESRRDARWKPLSLSSTIYQLAVASECTDHRDKVFAFLDMSSTGSHIKVDYDRDEALLFWDVLRPLEMKEISYQEVNSLREVLRLTWSRLLVSTARQIKADPFLEEKLFPCHLDCGILSLKRERAHQPHRKCKQGSFHMNCWFQKELGSPEVMLQMQLSQTSSDTYIINDAKYCPDENKKYLVGGILPSGYQIRILDESWSNRWETVAVGPLFYIVLCILADLDGEQRENQITEAFPNSAHTPDEYFKERRATKHFGMPLK